VLIYASAIGSGPSAGDAGAGAVHRVSEPTEFAMSAVGESKVVLITGASSGIGQATAEHLAHRGYVVYGTSRRETPQVEPFRWIRMDVSDDDSVAQGVRQVLEAEGHIDVLINNAGMGIAGAVEDTTVSEADLQMNTNFMGVFRLTKAVLPGMRERRSGMIVNLSSIGGLIAVPFQALYSASKFAMEGFSEALRLEVRDFNIKVVLIEPGDHKTDFTANRVRTAASQTETPYRERFERSLQIMEHDEQGGPPPEKVARLIEKVIQKKSPALRYTVGMLPQRVGVGLKRTLPGGAFEMIVRSTYKL
jgi:NAD(P)-dependent dehydrogenase (short-subunit alcohol dehydrogenase family)